MIHFETTIKQFGEKGEKTGWTYIEVPAELAQQLKAGVKKSFRVKGRLDNYTFRQLALLPMGDGNFILTLKADIRKKIGKQKGARIQVQMEADETEKKLPKTLLACLADEPEALAFFTTLPKSHQHYFGDWIISAKTEMTQTKRLTQAINALANGMSFSEMLRAARKDKLF